MRVTWSTAEIEPGSELEEGAGESLIVQLNLIRALPGFDQTVIFWRVSSTVSAETWYGNYSEEMKTREAQSLVMVKREKEEVKRRNGKFNFCWSVWWLYINIKLEGKDETETQRLKREESFWTFERDPCVLICPNPFSFSGGFFFFFFLVQGNFFFPSNISFSINYYKNKNEAIDEWIIIWE